MEFETKNVEIELEDLGASSGTRIWFEGEGYAKVIEGIRSCCHIAMVMGKKFPPDRGRAIDYFDCDSNFSHHFEQYRTDDYPPDGYDSIYFHPSDFVPSPWGDIGYVEHGNYDRLVRICHGVINHNPSHAEIAVANQAPPRLRPVLFSETWGIALGHTYANHEPTNRFDFLLETTLRSSRYGPNQAGFFKAVGAMPMSVEAIMNLPGLRQVYQQGKKVEILSWMMKSSYPIQKFDPRTRRWRGVVTADVKEGFFSTTRKEFFVE